MLNYQEFLDSPKQMSTKEWLAQFEAGTLPQHYIAKKDVYAYILFYRDEILLSLNTMTQAELGQKLNMSQAQLSYLMPILELHVELSPKTKTQLDKYWISTRSNSLAYDKDLIAPKAIDDNNTTTL